MFSRNLDAKWKYVDKADSQSLWFPKLKIRNAKEISAQEGYGPTVTHYYWYRSGFLK